MFEASVFINTNNVPFIEWYLSFTTTAADFSRACGGLSSSVTPISTRMTGNITNNTAADVFVYLNGKTSPGSVALTSMSVYLTRIA